MVYRCTFCTSVRRIYTARDKEVQGKEIVVNLAMLHGISVLREFTMSSLHALGIYCL